MPHNFDKLIYAVYVTNGIRGLKCVVLFSSTDWEALSSWLSKSWVDTQKTMDPVYTIKRKRQIDIDKLGCLFCNNSAGDLLFRSDNIAVSSGDH